MFKGQWPPECHKGRASPRRHWEHRDLWPQPVWGGERCQSTVIWSVTPRVRKTQVFCGVQDQTMPIFADWDWFWFILICHVSYPISFQKACMCVNVDTCVSWGPCTGQETTLGVISYLPPVWGTVPHCLQLYAGPRASGDCISASLLTQVQVCTVASAFTGTLGSKLRPSSYLQGKILTYWAISPAPRVQILLMPFNALVNLPLIHRAIIRCFIY